MKINKIKVPQETSHSTLGIERATQGFYKGLNIKVAIPAKIIITVLILWAVIFPETAGSILNDFNGFILSNFAAWYIWVTAFFLITCMGLAIWPAAGKLKLGLPNDNPEFSNFSWYSMMFGAGIGVGMLTWSVAEPLYHLQSSPETIFGVSIPNSEDNAINAFKWAFLNWGVSAWACYVVCGLSMAYFAYCRQLPLTIRSSLAALFGSKLEGGLGHLIDIVAVVATILGVAQTLGFGVEQFVAGMHRIGGGEWLINTEGTATPIAIIFAILIIVGASTFSALSGVGRGIKWLSNLNMGLSIFLLLFLLVFGSTWFGISILGKGLLEYLVNLPKMMFTVWIKDNTVTG